MPTSSSIQDQELTAFDVLDIISSAYAGKQMFFLQDDGMIYSRFDGCYMTFEQAVDFMAHLVGEE